MEINHINSTNFNGIYRMQYTAQDLEHIKSHVAPMYQYLKQEPILIFDGNNPFKIGVDIIMNLIANSQNSSTNWLKMNATRHGVDFEGLGSNTLHVISGRKEINNFLEYLQKRVAKKTSFFEKFKNIFSKNKNTYNDKPAHLRKLFEVLETNREENFEFQKAYNNRIVEVKTPQELLTKILCEKA